MGWELVDRGRKDRGKGVGRQEKEGQEGSEVIPGQERNGIS